MYKYLILLISLVACLPANAMKESFRNTDFENSSLSLGMEKEGKKVGDISGTVLARVIEKLDFEQYCTQVCRVEKNELEGSCVNRLLDINKVGNYLFFKVRYDDESKENKVFLFNMKTGEKIVYHSVLDAFISKYGFLVLFIHYSSDDLDSPDPLDLVNEFRALIIDLENGETVNEFKNVKSIKPTPVRSKNFCK